MYIYSSWINFIQAFHLHLSPLTTSLTLLSATIVLHYILFMFHKLKSIHAPQYAWIIVIKMASLDVYRSTRKQDRIGFKQIIIINHFLRWNIAILDLICSSARFWLKSVKTWHKTFGTFLTEGRHSSCIVKSFSAIDFIISYKETTQQHETFNKATPELERK